MRIFVAIFAVALASTAGETRIAPGLVVEEREFRRYDQGLFRIWVLRIDPKTPGLNVLPVHAKDRAMGLETPEGMARRYGAIAAVNGGYFAAGVYAGISKNNYVLNSRILGTWRDRSALIFCEEKRGVERAVVDMTRYDGVARAGAASWLIDGVNRERGPSELIWFTADLGPSTLTRGGVEVAIDSKGNLKAASQVGNMKIPAKGGVLSGAGRAGVWLERMAKAGRSFQVEGKIAQKACRATDIVSAGPRVVRGGKVDLSEKGFAHANARHPRTAAAISQTGELLFVVVDGRQAASVGMTLQELGETLVELGAVDAVNLDGGGSSAFYAAGKTWNRPSDGRQRPVSDALLIFSFPDWKALRPAIKTLEMSPALREKLIELGDLKKWAEMVKLLRAGGASENATRVLIEAVEGMR